MLFFFVSKLIRLLSRLSAKKEYPYTVNISDDEAIQNINYLAHSLRKVRSTGAGVPLFATAYAIKKAYKVLLEKERSGRELFAFEKWLKENYRLLYGRIQEVKQADFLSLPHTDGIPRVIILADYIVKCSGGRPDRKRIESIISAFCHITPLTYIELERIRTAIIYRLLCEVSVLAEKIIQYEVSYRAAKNGNGGNSKDKDSFLYFFARLKGEERADKEDLRSARIAFENILGVNERLTASYIESLRDIHSVFPSESYVALSKVNEIYLADEDYRRMSENAKKDYLLETFTTAKKCKATELAVARAVMRLAEEHERHFGKILYKQKDAIRIFLQSGRVSPLKDEDKKVQGVYCTLVLFFSILVALIPAYYLQNTIGYISILPLFIAALHPVEYLLKRFIGRSRKRRPLPEMEYDVFPESAATVVVVSRFISNEKDVDDAVLQIETLASSCRDKNVTYSVVADFPSSNEELSEEDRRLLAYIGKKRLSENVGFFVRKRKEKDGRWIAWERKRGALLDYLSAVRSGAFSEFYAFGAQGRGRFALLLDDDSELLPGTIRAAVSAMAHPLNEEYELMSFGGKVNRYSLTTYYSEKYSRSCSIDVYPYYSDFYADRFDCALYCGKAIIRIDAYLDKLSAFFQDGRILSHDIIEGAVLRSTSLKRCVYEDAPKNFASDHLRSMRWQRGDVQLLPYVFCNQVKKRDGLRAKNPIDAIYKLILFINGFSVLADFSVLLVVLLGFFFGNGFLVLYAFTVSVAIYAYALVDEFRTIFGKVRFRHVLFASLHSLWLLADQIFLLPFRAIGGAYIFFITSVKMAFRSKDLLNWTPFRSTQDGEGARDGAKMMLPTVIFLSFLVIIAGSFYVALYGLLCLFYMLGILFMGRKIQTKELSEDEKESLLEYAKRIYLYFRENDDESLITDNLQIFPYTIRAEMTSPTNLGFAILAEVCAALLELVDREKAIANISRVIDKVDRLEKWEGHLYNWYDVKTYRPLPPRVVSTVDSANFSASLYVALRFLSGTENDALSKRIEKIIAETNFDVLTDKNDRLLAITHNVSENSNQGKYDLLASEARLAYCIAVAKGADPKGYFSLGREYIPAYGNTLLSWSGTAFEYMLPRLFMKSPRGSLLDIQERNSCRVQMQEKTDGVFGRSECAYGEFNNATAYRYKAIGASPLALSGEKSDVIAPYASFLYLPCFPIACLKNIATLRRKEAEGKYGFYEAIDYERRGEIVRTFMTHHQGMSLAAITNLLSGDKLAELFSANKEIRAVRLLLAEENEHRIPPKVYRCPKKEFPAKKEMSYEPHEPAELYTDISGNYTFVQDILGRGFAKYKDIFITKYQDYKAQKGGVFFQIKEGGNVTSPTFYPNGEQSCFATLSESGISYCNPGAGLSLSAYLLHGYDGEMRKLIIRNDQDVPRSLEISVYADVILNARDAYDSHPAFSDMFVSSEYDEKSGLLFLSRKDLSCKRVVSAAMGLRGCSEMKYNSNRYNVFGRNGEMRDRIAEGICRDVAPAFGDILYPCFAATGKAEVAPHGETVIYCYILAGEEKDSLRLTAERLDAAYRSGALDLLGQKSEKEETDIATVARIGAELLQSYPSENALRARSEHKDLFPDGGNEDIVFYPTALRDAETEVEAVARACDRLNRSGIGNRLAISGLETGAAEQDWIGKWGESLKERYPNVVFVPQEKRDAYRACALVDLSGMTEKKFSLEKEAEIHAEKDSLQSELLLRTGEGGFTHKGYSVRPFGENTLLPYANVVAGREGGFVITEQGGGFSFGKNSREDKMTIWSGDPVEDFVSEAFFLVLGGKRYRLNRTGCSHEVGMTSFESAVKGVRILLRVYPIEEGRTKVYEIFLSGETFKDAEFRFEIHLALDWRYSKHVLAKEEGNDICFVNVANGKTMWVQGDMPLSCKAPELKSHPFSVGFTGEEGRRTYRLYLSSEKRVPMSEKELVLSRAKTVDSLCRNRIKVKTIDPGLDLLYNVLLPYQVQSARLNAKTGFCQCGGATGFRDQLQDVLSLLISNPSRAREQILLSASHQYEEGDVQHWWHEPRIGVRTRISDDKLWLGYITAKYVSVTNDHSILDEILPFLRSNPLGKEENSRYEIPMIGEKASISEHILRAIRQALQYGEHDLLKIGTGDWNDGLDRVGAAGRGESVWLTMFAVAVLKEMMDLYPKETRKEFLFHIQKMQKALDGLKKEGRYPLCFTDDGKWLGYADTPACTLALNPQSWSVISGAVCREDALLALDTAGQLVSPIGGIVKLSEPPFDERSNYGYIAAYPKGVRENGGQYTHAAIWYLKALLEAGEGDAAYRIFKMLNPITKCASKEGALKYMAEPYVLAGDVYGASPYIGRAGWTWYTGSAAWLKYTLTEDFFGVRKRGDRIYVKPCFPHEFQEAVCTLRLEKKEVEIRYLRGEKERLIVLGEERDFIDLLVGENKIEAIRYFV